MLYHALKQQSFPLRAILYFLTLYVFWFAFSFAHGILIINSIASGSDKVVANATRTVETVTSSSFVNILIAAPFLHPNSKCRFSLTYTVLSNLVIYIMAVVIIILSLSMVAGSTDTLIALIVCRSLLLIASIAVFIFAILYKNPLKTTGPLSLLWRERKLLVIAFPYFLLSCSYFLYTLSTVVNNTSCIENVELLRVVWLVLNCSLRIFEVIFLIVCFRKARNFINELMVVIAPKSRSKRKSKAHSLKCQSSPYLGPLLLDTSPSNLSYKTREAKDSTTYYFPTKSVKSVNKEDIFDSEDSEKQQAQQIYPVTSEIEIEQLPCTPNLNANFNKSDCEMQNVASIELSQSTSC